MGKRSVDIQFQSENLTVGGNSIDSGIDESSVLKWILRETVYGDVQGVHVAEDKVQWFAVVNTVTNIQFTEKTGNLLSRSALFNLFFFSRTAVTYHKV